MMLLTKSYFFKLFDKKMLFCQQLPANVNLSFSTDNTIPASRKGKGKCKQGESDPSDLNLSVAFQENRLTTLDIFAGCGGLSEGLQKSSNHFSSLPVFIQFKDFINRAFNLQGFHSPSGQLNTTNLQQMHLALIIQRRRCLLRIAM